MPPRKWTRSSYCSSGSCIEWSKSTYSGGSGCVETATPAGTVLVRDSKLTDSPVLAFDPDVWRAFVDGIKDLR